MKGGLSSYAIKRRDCSPRDDTSRRVFAYDEPVIVSSTLQVQGALRGVSQTALTSGDALTPLPVADSLSAAIVAPAPCATSLLTAQGRSRCRPGWARCRTGRLS